MAEYNVTVFPLPVGPVTRIMPWGYWEASRYNCNWSSSIPMVSIPRLAAAVSSTRMTIFSPNRVGIVLILKSIARFLEKAIFMRPPKRFATDCTRSTQQTKFGTTISSLRSTETRGTGRFLTTTIRSRTRTGPLILKPTCNQSGGPS